MEWSCLLTAQTLRLGLLIDLIMIEKKNAQSKQKFVLFFCKAFFKFELLI